MQLTADLIRSVCPDGIAAYVEAMASPEANALYAQWGIAADPLIMASFMANVDHETGGFTIVRENLRYSAGGLMRTFGIRYGIGRKGPDGRPNRDSDGDGLSDLAEAHAGNELLIGNHNYGHRLGNEDDGTNDDDGYRFRGGGPLQATAKGFYRWLAKETGIPFERKPELIEVPANWPIVAVLTWCKHPSAGNMNPFAEAGNFEACCRGINTGSPHSTFKFNGFEDRQDKLIAWCGVLGARMPKPSAVYRLGVPRSSAVRAIQARLNALMYAEGRLAVDGDFGKRTRSAIYDFQLENNLAADGVVGAVTWSALFSSAARPWPKPRSAMLGLVGLAAIGDDGYRDASRDRAVGAVTFAGGAMGLANSTGLLDYAGEFAKDAGAWQSVLTTILAASKFGAANLLPILAIVVGLLLIRKYGRWVFETVERWSRPIEGEAEPVVVPAVGDAVPS